MAKMRPERQTKDQDVPLQKVEGGGVRNEKDEQKIANAREMIRNACTRVLQTEEQKEIEEALQLFSARIQVAACETPEDFRALFQLHGIEGKEWMVSKNIPFSFRQIIRDRFGSWETFLDFMILSQDRIMNNDLLQYPYRIQVAACETPDDFRTLFRLHGIEGEKWRVSTYISDNISEALYQKITLRFGSWDGFLVFMGPASKRKIDAELLKLSYPTQVATCETPDDFRTLFRLHGIEDEAWRVSRYVTRNISSGFYENIRFRFGSWNDFLVFIRPSIQKVTDKDFLTLPYTQQITYCETPDDFRTLFRLHRIQDEQWRIGKYLRKHISSGFTDAIYNDPRFGSWDAFLQWMDQDADLVEQDQLTELKLEEAEALLGHDPAKLKFYIQLAHPELAEEEVNRIVLSSFKRLSTRKRFEYSDFDDVLPACDVSSDIPRETNDSTLLLTGKAEEADSVIISASRSSRRVRTAPDGTFEVRIPLALGVNNTINIYPVHHGEKKRGEMTSFSVLQTDEEDDIQHIVDLLGEMSEEVLDSIRKDRTKIEYVARQTEQVFIRKFSRNFDEGRASMEEYITKTKSPVVKKILTKVLDRFRRIDRTKYPHLRPDSPLYFFQKYCVYSIQERIRRGDAGVILANAPGLGKTRTALAALNGDPATIIAPNSVVSSWAEEAQRCLVYSDLLVLQNIPHPERVEKLRNRREQHVVTNIEFLRAKEGDPRYELLADEDTIVVHDEAHTLNNLSSEQSQGARRLNGKFQLFLSATPFKNPKQMRRMLHHLYPDDPRFSSDKAFSQAFPSNDPQALRTLNLLKEQYVLRFRKEDVLEEMDPSLPLDDQLYRLPRKEHLSSDQYGGCTMSEEQAQAIFELFLDWTAWCKKYGCYIPTDEIAKMDHLRQNQYSFAKVHALRQIANNPEYIGQTDIQNAKTEEMKRSIDACLAEGRKVVIFCQYNAQAQKYSELLKEYSPSLYTGMTSKKGLQTSEAGHTLRYKKDENGGWELDAYGYPILDPFGEPMLALDYERLTFQNAPDRKIMISTYSAGAVGVTFTAGKAVIFDDLPRDCVEEIQAEDRTHRIDLEHQTHHSVKYIRMVSHYPKAFLERMKKTFVWKKGDGTYAQTTTLPEAQKHDYQTAYDLFFAQGTYDEWKLQNLTEQRRMFQLINDGIADESILHEGQTEFSVNLD